MAEFCLRSRGASDHRWHQEIQGRKIPRSEVGLHLSPELHGID